MADLHAECVRLGIDPAAPDAVERTLVAIWEERDRQASEVSRIVDACQPRVEALKREIGSSPSELYTTVSSFTLREIVRALDTIGSVLR